MTVPLSAGQTVVSRLRVRSRGLDPLSARLRAEGLLSAAQLRPPGLAPSAILCVRRLRDPRPGLLSLRPGARPPVEWEQAVQGALEAASRRATRPARGAVPADADAVLFADRAEWLTCLAVDLGDGTLITRWWWQALRPGPDPARRVAAAWLDTPEAAPAALEHLAARGRALGFVRALDGPEAETLTRRIVRAFALTDMQAALDRGRAAQEPGVPPTAREGRHEPAWRAIVPEVSGSDLTGPRRVLLALGLTLRRAPAVARTRAFAEDVVSGHPDPGVRPARPTAPPAVSNSETPTLPPDAPQRLTPPTDPAAPQPSDGANLEPSRPTAETAPPNDNAARAPSVPRGGDSHQRPTLPAPPSPATPARPPALTPGQAREGAPDLREPTTREAVARPCEPAPARPDGPPTDPESPRAAAESPPSPAFPEVEGLPAVVVETEIGGVFYLINLGLALGLYGDFTTPLTPGIALPIWDFLALLARELLGDGVTADPAWPLLAWLAGRSEGEEPGLGFDPPDRWRLPPEWLKAFPEPGVWAWSSAFDRLRVRHDEPFPVLDLPLGDGDPEAQAVEATRGYREWAAFRLERGASAGEPPDPSPLARWVGWLSAYVRRRLARAVGVSDPAGAAAMVCRCRAKVFVTAVNLDVVLALADLPVEVRRAGLDRDPGWVPAAGRYVAFHFE